MNPLTHAPIVTFLGLALGPLRAEATRPQQAPDVIRMVADVKVATDHVGDPSARPQAGAIPRRLRPRDHEAR
jgi:hypothetical protein